MTKTIEQLNKMIIQGDSQELINREEKRQTDALISIADTICANKDELKVVLICGPSSVGKTTTATRLAEMLLQRGMGTLTISTDDYFRGRDCAPLDDEGERNYETIEAIDTELFNIHINGLIKGEQVELPIYNFNVGARSELGRLAKLDKNSVMVVEGIHGLNEKLTYHIAKKYKYKIFLNNMFQFNETDFNETDEKFNISSRFVRRMVRDYYYRSSMPLNTFKMWQSVRRGEKQYIFPFEKDADVIFNTALAYELCILKSYAEPLFKEVLSNERYSRDAEDILGILSKFESIDRKMIPKQSLLNEFLPEM